MEERSKISVVEALFVLLICAGVDFMELTLSFTGIALLLSFVDFFVWILFTILFSMKGGGYNSIIKKIILWTFANVLEIIPALEMLPIRTIVMFWIILSFNKEADVELTEKLDKISHYSKLAERFIEKRLG
jgi:hypothetical protein